MRDENSLRQKTQKAALLGHREHNLVNMKYKASNSVNMKNKTSNKACEYKNSMQLKEFLDYFNKQDLPVTDFMRTKEFRDYSDSNNMTTLRLVNELRSDPRTREREEKRFVEKEGTGRSNVRRQEEMTEESNIETIVLVSKKSIVHCEGKTNVQFKMTSGIPEGNSQVSRQKERSQLNKDKAIADDGQSFCAEPWMCTST